MSGSMVRWAIRNTPAMNTVVLAVLIVGVSVGVHVAP
jgi:hypothetical protein